LVSALALFTPSESLAAERKSYSRVRALGFGSGDYRTGLYILGNPRDKRGLNVMVQGCIHGDESSGREASFALIDAYEGGKLQLTGLTLYVIPELNRPACRAGIRNFYPGADPSKEAYLRNNDLINMARAWPIQFDKKTKTYVGSYSGGDHPGMDAGSLRSRHPPDVVQASVKIAKFVRKEVIPLVDGTSRYRLPRMDGVFCLHSVTYNLQYAGINLEGAASGRLYQEALRVFSADEVLSPEHAIPGDDCYFPNSALGIYGIVIDVPTKRATRDGRVLPIPLKDQAEEALRYLVGLINRVIPNTEMKSNPESPWIGVNINYPPFSGRISAALKER
jgi:hypothetical protein